MPHRILVTEPIVEEAIARLTSSGAEVVVGKRGTFTRHEALEEAIPEFDGLLSLLSNPVNRAVLTAGKRLKVVANYAVGHNNVDSQAAKELGIRVTNTPGVLTEATADTAWALLLATARKIPESEAFLRAGSFDGWDPLGFVGYDLNGKNLGIIGMGRIGQAVARRAVGFGMKIHYTNRRPVDSMIEHQLGAMYVEDYRELARMSDVLSLNCPLTPESHHMLDRELLRQMKPTSIVINTGRGPLIDEGALAEALSQGWIGGAGLDVFEEEPIIHPDLLKAPNAVLVPHIGSATHDTRRRMAMLATGSLLHILDGKPAEELTNLVV